uniref:Uncharacterized protein n=1 Tax=Brassica oleracea TaxID=3712 RepID=A0A3P6C4F1_BRAOL|nr:unnamed protein product [Brassica oleracea]
MVEATPGHQLNLPPSPQEKPKPQGRPKITYRPCQDRSRSYITFVVGATAFTIASEKREKRWGYRLLSPKTMINPGDPYLREAKTKILSPDRRVIDASTKREKQDGSDYEGNPKENVPLWEVKKVLLDLMFKIGVPLMMSQSLTVLPLKAVSHFDGSLFPTGNSKMQALNLKDEGRDSGVKLIVWEPEVDWHFYTRYE